MNSNPAYKTKGVKCRRERADEFKPCLQEGHLLTGFFSSNPPAMHLEPLSELSWAYRLHYDLAFQTHWRRRHFKPVAAADHLTGLLKEICSRHGYHELETKVYPDHVRLLISLRPADALSKALHSIKTNSSAEMCRRLGITAPLWARGYLARSVGRISVKAVECYLALQPEHHGYARRIRPPVHRFRAVDKKELKTDHASFDLIHHIVFSTGYRKGVFSSTAGAALAQYWLRVADKHGFAIDQMSFLPDHVRLLVRTHPKSSVESVCLSLLNNAQYFMTRRFGSLLIEAGVERLWQASAFARTCGQMTTALTGAVRILTKDVQQLAKTVGSQSERLDSITGEMHDGFNNLIAANETMRQEMREGFNKLILANEVTRELTTQIGKLAYNTP